MPDETQITSLRIHLALRLDNHDIVAVEAEFSAQALHDGDAFSVLLRGLNDRLRPAGRRITHVRLLSLEEYQTIQRRSPASGRDRFDINKN